MKSRFTLLTLTLIGALLAGCATSDLLNKLHIGMTKDEVISVLGRPDATGAQGSVEYLTYYLQISTSYGSEREQPYLVRIVNGKVESFGRYSQLYDLYNRPVAGGPQPANGAPIFPTNSPYAQAVMNSAPTPAPAATPPVMDLASQLEKLKALKDQGVLTDEEFQKAKEKLLASQK